MASGPSQRRVPESDFAAAFAQSSSGFAVLDDGLQVLDANRALHEVLSAETLVGGGLGGWFRTPALLLEGLAALRSRPSVRFDVELADGRWGHVVASRYATAAGRRVLLHVEDVSERKQEEQRLNHQATHDGLTGVANPTVLHARLATVLAGGHSAALLFLDLDRFKLVNDSLGHAAGDQLLRQVARRITEAVRPGDLVARLGGDEFVVLCERLDESAARAVAGRIITQLRPPVLLPDGVALVAVPSIGIRMTGPGDSLADVVRDADTAMYAAKAAGGNAAEVFTSALRADVVRRHATELALRAALEGDELWLAYQPIVDGRGRATALEALLRWTRSEDPASAPSGLIEVADQSDLVHDLGSWVLERALRDAAAAPLPMRIHVNVSPRQLVPGFTGRVAELIANLRLDPSRICLEITETAVSARIDELATQLAELRQLGVRLAIDDFGVGQASLTYLARLPVHEVKIDRSFVHGLPDDPGSAAIVAGVAGMARAYGLSVVAEGVETSRQHAAARRLGCALTQGFLHAPAMPIELAHRWAAASAKGLPTPRRPAIEGKEQDLSDPELRQSG